MEDFDEFMFTILGVVLLFFLSIMCIKGCQAPKFIETSDGIVMNYDKVYDNKLETGYYTLQKVKIETRIKNK